MKTYIEWPDGTSRARLCLDPPSALEALANDIRDRPDFECISVWLEIRGTSDSPSDDAMSVFYLDYDRNEQ